MLNEDYHANPAVNKSSLDVFAKSPWHYWMTYLNPDRPQRESTKSMQTGTIIHAAILEPELFSRTYAVSPNCRRGTKEWEKAQAENDGKILLKPDEMDDILKTRDAVLTDPVAALLLKDAQFEQSYFWQDPDTGLQCKCRPDALKDWVCDIKKTASVTPYEFQNSAAQYRYFIQAAFYLDGIFHSTGKKRDGFVFICVEDKYPYATACYMYEEEDIQYAREEYQRLLSQLKICKENNLWPKLNEEIRQLKIPSWKKVR